MVPIRGNALEAIRSEVMEVLNLNWKRNWTTEDKAERAAYVQKRERIMLSIEN